MKGVAPATQVGIGNSAAHQAENLMLGVKLSSIAQSNSTKRTGRDSDPIS